MNNDITVKDLIISKLKKLGCDGLASDECGCGIEDLAPCGGCFLGCLPARARVTPSGIEWHAVGFQRLSDSGLPNSLNKPPAATHAEIGGQP